MLVADGNGWLPVCRMDVDNDGDGASLEDGVTKLLTVPTQDGVQDEDPGAGASTVDHRRSVNR